MCILVSIRLCACATAMTFSTQDSLRLNPGHPAPTHTQRRIMPCVMGDAKKRTEMKERKTGGRRRKQTLASLGGEQMEPREGREEEERGSERGRRGEAHNATGHGGWTDSICSRLSVALVMDGGLERHRARDRRQRDWGRKRWEREEGRRSNGAGRPIAACVRLPLILWVLFLGPYRVRLWRRVINSNKGMTDRWTDKRARVTKRVRRLSQRRKGT